MSLSISICAFFAAFLIWRLSCLVKARPMGMIVSWPVFVDLLATAIAVLSAGITVHYVTDDPSFTECFVSAFVSVIALVVAMAAANERRRRGGEVYEHA